MAVTRLKRKRLKNKVRSTWRKNVLKHRLAKPVLKKPRPAEESVAEAKEATK
ncbi:MAG: hypothetical protein ACPGC9_00745 [Cytophagales bacterium]